VCWWRRAIFLSNTSFLAERARPALIAAQNEHTPSSASPSAAGDKVEHKLSFSHKKAQTMFRRGLKKVLFQLFWVEIGA
jgi:hypothetical protein